MENQSLFKNEPDTKPLGKKSLVKRKEVPKLGKIERRKTTKRMNLIVILHRKKSAYMSKLKAIIR